MTKYLKISASAEDARQVNVEGTTALLHSNNGTYIYDAEGMFYGREDKARQLDGAAIVADIQSLQPGKVFVPVGLFDHEDKPRGTYYIDPAAVTYMTVSVATPEGSHGIIIGVQGVGTVESHIETSALTTLVDAVRGTGKNLLALDANEANARWSRPEMLYVDTASITRIRQDGGGQLWTSFKNSGELDIQIAKVDQQKIYQDLITQSPDLRDNFNQVSWLLQAEERKQENAALARLAQKMSVGNAALVHVPSNDHALYLQQDDIRSVHASQRDEGKHQLYIEFKKTAGDQYGQRASLYFATSAECEAALTVAITEKPAKQAAKLVLKAKK